MKGLWSSALKSNSFWKKWMCSVCPPAWGTEVEGAPEQFLQERLLQEMMDGDALAVHHVFDGRSRVLRGSVMAVAIGERSLAEP